MLKTMLWQGVLAALLIGGAAAGYAQVRDTGYLAAPRDSAKPERADRPARKAKDHDHAHDDRQRAERKEARHD